MLRRETRLESPAMHVKPRLKSQRGALRGRTHNSRAGRLLVASGIAVLLGAATALPVSGVSVTASSLLAAARHDAIAARSVHEVGLNEETTTTEKVENDIGVSAGEQRYRFSNGSSATVIALDSKGKAYIRGSAAALVDFFGLTISDPSSYANKWLLVTPSDPNYNSVAAATTLKSDFDLSLNLTGHLALGPVTSLLGASVRSIKGVVPAQEGTPSYTETVYISLKGKPLPLELIATVGGVSLKVTWSHWGESLKVAAPPSSIPEPVTATTA